MIKNCFTLIFGLLSAMCVAQPRPVDGVAAVVGKNIVLMSDVQQQYDQLVRQGLAEDESDQCKIFEDLLLEKLLLHQADIDSIAVSPDQVDMNIERRLQVYIQQIGSVQKLEQYYKKSVVEIKDEMRPYVEDQLTAQKMLAEITGDVEITPSEVRAYFKPFPQDSLPLINAQVEYAQIVRYPLVSTQAKEEAIARLNDFRERIENGSSFSTLAVLYSEDPGSAKNGGEYKGIKRGQFVKEFEAVAFNLKAGEISEPFKTEYGYHIVQLQLRKGEELDLRHILIKPKISSENLEAAKSYLDSVKQAITEGRVTFEEAAMKASDDENSKLNGGIAINPQTGDSRWETGQLVKSDFYVLDRIAVNTISAPEFFREPDGKEGYKLVKVISKSEAHRANLKTDYQQMQMIALESKKNNLLKEWVEDKVESTYIRVNNTYLECDFKTNWIKRSSQYVE
jgi:peptidyl-prolyl cis-trans isomerase SurA